jgi:hypothetical protein
MAAFCKVSTYSSRSFRLFSPFITNFPTIHNKLLENICAFVMCSHFSSLTNGPTGIHYEIGPSFVFQAAWI